MNAVSNPADDREELLKMFPPDEDYRFRMNYRRVPDPRAYLASSGDGELLRERREILGTSPERHAGLLPEGVPHFDDLVAFAAESGAVGADDAAAIRAEEDLQRRCVELARRIEPDFAVMRAGFNRSVRLVGGAVCFPSSWSPETKIGMELSDIHAVVPGLNGELGKNIAGAMLGLKPGTVGMRADWSMKPTTDRNYHPRLGLPLPTAAATLDDTFIRVERQMMIGLPERGGATGVAFCIRIALYRVLDMARDPELRAGVARALRTLPPDVAAYKDVVPAVGPLVRQLDAL